MSLPDDCSTEIARAMARSSIELAATLKVSLHQVEAKYRLLKRSNELMRQRLRCLDRGKNDSRQSCDEFTQTDAQNSAAPESLGVKRRLLKKMQHDGSEGRTMCNSESTEIDALLQPSYAHSDAETSTYASHCLIGKSMATDCDLKINSTLRDDQLARHLREKLRQAEAMIEVQDDRIEMLSKQNQRLIEAIEPAMEQREHRLKNSLRNDKVHFENGVAQEQLTNGIDQYFCDEEDDLDGLEQDDELFEDVKRIRGSLAKLLADIPISRESS